MTDNNRRQRGEEMLRDVYAGAVEPPPEGYAFTDVMLEQLFAEVWTRDTLSMRDKRLLLIGIIAEKGEATTMKIQVKASLQEKLSRCDVDLKRAITYSGVASASAALFLPPTLKDGQNHKDLLNSTKAQLAKHGITLPQFLQKRLE